MGISKREKTWKSKLTPGKQYSIDEALKLVKEFATAKFNETVDCSVNLGIDASKSDQQVRGSTVMPHGTGKTLRVAVFTAGKNVELAKAAGADIVGMDDLAAQVKAGNINFDRVIASPDAMRVVGQLGQILGPRGLMPNPKVGTVTPDVATAVKNAKAGQVTYRVDKPRPKVLFEPGEVVRVTNGPFNDFNGVVENVNYEKSRLQVAVQILGRSTPVELDFGQVEKV